MLGNQTIMDASHNSRIAEITLIRFTDNFDAHARNVEKSICHKIGKKIAKIRKFPPKM